MKNSVNPTSALVQRHTHMPQYAAPGNHCVITQTTKQIWAPQPPATPQANQPMKFAGLMICSGIRAISKSSWWPGSQIGSQKHVAPGEDGDRGGGGGLCPYLQFDGCNLIENLIMQFGELNGKPLQATISLTNFFLSPSISFSSFHPLILCLPHGMEKHESMKWHSHLCGGTWGSVSLFRWFLYFNYYF